MLDKGLKTETWPPEKLAAHLKAIGADKPPEQRKRQTSITAPRMTQGSNHYAKRGGEW